MATCTTTSARRRLNFSRPAVSPRPPERITVAGAMRVARSAGARPNRMQVRIAVPPVNPRTRQSRANPTNMRFCSVVRKAISTRLSAAASPAPSAAPRRASSMLSDSSCRITRDRDAPIACRTAISRSRVLARASRRFARLAHAISKTSPVVARRIHSGSWYWPRNCETPVAPEVTVSLLARNFFASSTR